jgi:hypothetical protein
MNKVEPGAPRYTATCYTSFDQNLDVNLDIAARRISAGNRRDKSVDDAVVAFATKLWRLYDSRTDLIIPWHYKLACRAMEMLPLLSPYAQKEAALKLACFVSPEEPASSQRQYLLPMNDIEIIAPGNYRSIGEDPSFLLVGTRLKTISGDVLVSFDAKVIYGELFGPLLYLDTGNGFSEEQTISISEGLFTSCSVEISIPSGTRRIRFDPGATPATFKLVNFILTPAPASHSAIPSNLFATAELLIEKITAALPYVEVRTAAELSALTDAAKALVETGLAMERARDRRRDVDWRDED